MSTVLVFPELLLRLSSAFLAGLVVGMERETRGRPAGMRTLILVTLASALAMALAEITLSNAAGSPVVDAVRADPLRLGAGILTGIGFLGAATIIRHDNIVRGVTTAASLWFMAVVGLAFGAGQFVLGCTGTVAALIALVVLHSVEHKLPSDRYSRVTVTSKAEGLSAESLRNQLEHLGCHVIHVELEVNLPENEQTLACELRLNKGQVFQISNRFLEEIRNNPAVRRVTWR